jgi:glucosamine-6-phosphate isomerase
MQINIYKDYAELSFRIARVIVQQIKEQPDSVICLASGETPLLAYALMSKIITIQRVDTSQCTFVGLDEWVGIPKDNTGSCHYFLRQNVFDPLQLKPHQIKLFNALSDDLKAECDMMDDFIRSRGGINLMVVGIGMNGHIGFNEPGVSSELYSHIINLDNKTQAVGQKYFTETTVLKQGITLGLKHFMESKISLLMANGLIKADIMKLALEGKISNAVPASIIQKHPRGIVMLDEAAATHLAKKI